MNGQGFEEQIREYWIELCRSMELDQVGPGVILDELEIILNWYVDHKRILGYELTDTEFKHCVDDHDDYHWKGFVVICATFPNQLGRYQVSLAFDSVYTRCYADVPPKTIDRWEAIAMELENEVSSNPEEYEQEDRTNSGNN